ncbi:DNA-formamidopyrimidine glycosylase [Aeribacillus alveayuensis]|uniref:Formamidopyrimidine-DNA glycosylase n=1 Tax=Aeribacillus alveayuensis TaxID=279215 RepID=A0ABT9VJG0_9BACI|nr:formamidopyrimidine-DNA glycosylase [Bacillus alveayuensis]
MPELPEVETIRRTLLALVKGKKIQEVHIFWPKMIKKPVDFEQFCDALIGQTIHDIRRTGKYLKFYFDDYVLVSHLRMEGRYGLYSKEDPIEKHTHAIFKFIDQTELRYKDVRKFGTMHLFKLGEEEGAPPLSQLGPEPFSELFTVEYLRETFSKTSRKIKVALLDQTIVAGLGNIYVDEALFRAQIHPERLAKDLQLNELKRLHEQIIETLQEAVEKGGSTVRSYINSQGQIGMFQLNLNVYGRNGEPCRECGTSIEKIMVGGRGTHFCPKCQN